MYLFFFKFFSHLRLLQNIEQSSLCYTVGPNIAVIHTDLKQMTYKLFHDTSYCTTYGTALKSDRVCYVCILPLLWFPVNL